jgi:hypothetical protein
MSQPFPADPFFTGNYAPLSFEADAPDVPVRGELPKEISPARFTATAPIRNSRRATMIITGSSVTA